jgi:Fe-S-cluster containining protein
MVNGFEMRRNKGRCVALEGRLGHEVSCTIYDQRPEICRTMEKGSMGCLAIRANWGFR